MKANKPQIAFEHNRIERGEEKKSIPILLYCYTPPATSNKLYTMSKCPILHSTKFSYFGVLVARNICSGHNANEPFVCSAFVRYVSVCTKKKKVVCCVRRTPVHLFTRFIGPTLKNTMKCCLSHNKRNNKSKKWHPRQPAPNPDTKNTSIYN